METTTTKTEKFNFNNLRVDYKVMWLTKCRGMVDASEIATYWDISLASVKRSLARLETAGKVFFSYDVSAWRLV